MKDDRQSKFARSNRLHWHWDEHQLVVSCIQLQTFCVKLVHTFHLREQCKLTPPAIILSFFSRRRRALFGYIFCEAVLAAAAAPGLDRDLCGGNPAPDLFPGG